MSYTLNVDVYEDLRGPRIDSGASPIISFSLINFPCVPRVDEIIAVHEMKVNARVRQVVYAVEEMDLSWILLKCVMM